VKLQVRARWIVFVALAPFLVLGLLVLGARLYDLVRYDPAYFSDMYRETYDEPGETARTLETAIQTGNQALMAELQGARWPTRFEASPDINFVMLLDRTGDYITYLYFDKQHFERHPHSVRQVNGRWVVSPEDVPYYLNSGRWKRVFMPLAIIWWLIGFLLIGFVWIFRSSEQMRARLYGE
jgi:hypothetical protein